MRTPDYTYHDDLLEQMRPYGCELKNGFSNHSPMVIEALANLGYGDSASAWFEQHKHEVKLRPVSSQAIDESDWRSALTDSDRYTDWANYFSSHITLRGWRPTLARWIPALADGFISAACHGVIRVGHATRALRTQDTQARRQELAFALASWCSQYQSLRKQHTPQEIGKGMYNGDEILAHLPLLDASLRRNDGAITHALAQLNGHNRFFAAASNFQCDDIDIALAKMAQSAAWVFIHNSRSTLTAIVFTHAITSVAAASHIAPTLASEHRPRLAYEAFLAVCALHAVYANAPLEPINKQTRLTPDEAIAQAVNHGNDHVIKLTDACVGFYAHTEDANFLLAADLGASLIPSDQ